MLRRYVKDGVPDLSRAASSSQFKEGRCRLTPG